MIHARGRGPVNQASIQMSRDLMGMNWEGLSNSVTIPPTVAYPTVQFRYARIWQFTGTKWSEIETSAGVYDFTTLKGYVQAFIAADPTVRIIYCPGWNGTPAFYSGGPTTPPTDPTVAGNFLAALLNEPGLGQYIWAFEGGNEVQDSSFYAGTKAQLVTLNQACYTAVKAVRSNIVYMTPSTVGSGGPAYLDAYLALGGDACADMGCLHCYPASATPDVDTVIARYRLTKAVFAKYPKIPSNIISTEGGWGNNTFISDQTQQASYLIQYFLRLWWEGISAVCWYSWQGKTANGNWGTLWDIVGLALTAPGVTWGVLYGWINNKQLVGLWQTGNFWYATISDGTGYFGTIVWSSSNATVGPALTYTPLAGVTRYVDQAGAVTAYTTGTVSVTNPLLFDNTAP